MSSIANLLESIKQGRDGRDGRDGLDGIDGRDGQPGPRGFTGAPPNHAWEDTALRLEGADGKWGEAVNLRGLEGKVGRDGQDGRDGVDGRDGAPGMPGGLGSRGEQGKAGETGPRGPIGPMGPMPEHQWDNTRLRFELPRGWGPWTELRGPPGATAFVGRGGGGGGGMSEEDADLRYLQLAGGTLTGALTLPGNPSSALQAATKAYVDAHAGDGSGSTNTIQNGEGAPESVVSIFTDQTPVILNATDGTSYEMGTKFSVSANGTITHIRYWLDALEDVVTHTGRIWSAGGTELASVVFASETGSGWQQQELTTPLAVTAGSTYTVSVNVNGGYVTTAGGLSAPITHGALTALTSGGVFGTTGSYPTTTFGDANYFRDVVFVPASAFGADGDFYIDTAAWDIYGPRTDGDWGDPTSLIGPAGATGSTGATGPTGPAGPGTPSPLTTKGDVYAFGSADARLPVGSNDQVLTADSTQTLGVKWATPAGGSSSVPGYAYKNAIMNGDFQVWQRGITWAGLTSGIYLADRWFYAVGSFDGALDFNQSTTVPSIAQAGCIVPYSLKASISNRQLTLTAGTQVYFGTRVEGYTWQHYAQREITLSFWAYGNKTGVYCVSLFNIAGDRSIVKEWTLSAANTWEKKTLTFAASPSAGTWDYTTGTGLQVFFSLAVGSTYQTATPDVWQTGQYTATAAMVNFADAFTNLLHVTLVQLEGGTTATDFEFLPIDVLQTRCERYFEKTFTLTLAPVYGGGHTSNAFKFSQPVAANTDFDGAKWMFRTRKRVAPTITTYNPVASGGNAQVRNLNTGTDCSGISTVANENGVSVAATSPSGSAAGQALAINITADADL